MSAAEWFRCRLCGRWYEAVQQPSCPECHPSAPNEIDNSFRTHPLEMVLNRDAPKVACCPRDGEPLVSTFERTAAEFHCVICGGWFGWLAPVGKTETPELMARCQELTTQYDNERIERVRESSTGSQK